jgi:hypothetical protein
MTKDIPTAPLISINEVHFQIVFFCFYRLSVINVMLYSIQYFYLEDF